MPATYAAATSEAERSVMPGLAAQEVIGIETQLLLANLVTRLQRVVTDPGSGDRAFLHAVRGKRPSTLSEAQRVHVLRLAWRYRTQLPPGLRPGRDPDKTPNAEVSL